MHCLQESNGLVKDLRALRSPMHYDVVLQYMEDTNVTIQDAI